jgi:5-methylcytosine-specific restriction endonuclease McrA
MKKNNEEYRDSRKQWWRNNPEKIKEYNDWTKMHKTHEITQEELNELYNYANHSCMYCGISEEESLTKYSQKLHRDHAINEGSNKIDNCILACRGCNVSKRDKDWEQWYVPTNPRYDQGRYRVIMEWLNNFQ